MHAFLRNLGDAPVAQVALIYGNRRADAGARNRREHRRLQRDERDSRAIVPCEPRRGGSLTCT